MKIISDVKFYAHDDVLYSRAGFVALDDALSPCGVFIPGVKAFESVVSTDELSDSDVRLTSLAANFKAMTGQ